VRGSGGGWQLSPWIEASQSAHRANAAAAARQTGGEQ